MKWHESKLGDVITLQRGHDLPNAVRKKGEVPVVSSSGITGQHDEAKASAPGVVTGRYGTIGEVFYIEQDYWPLNTSLYVKDFKNNLPRFIAYLLRNVLRNYKSDKAAVPGVNRNVLHEIKILFPDAQVQQAIASILSAYDNLIENNRRRIQLLEQAARLLYKEWFVHLRFPGHQHAKIIDGVPEGWNRAALSELAEFINGFAFKPSHLGEEGLPIVKIPELKQGVTNKTPRNPGDLIPEKYHIYDGDLLFSWSGTLAVNLWTSGPALLNQHLFNVVPRDRVGRAFMMCALREALVQFDNHTVGATMKHIRRSALEKVFVLLPDKAILSIAEETLENIYHQLVALHKHNQKLSKARDLLLPKLMNGEVVV